MIGEIIMYVFISRWHRIQDGAAEKLKNQTVLAAEYADDVNNSRCRGWHVHRCHHQTNANWKMDTKRGYVPTVPWWPVLTDA